MSKWKTIASAPLDGTTILLCRAWDADGKRIAVDAAGVSMQVASWWGEPDGWVVYCSMVLDPQLHFEPTHWMPLPAMPRVRARKP